MKAENSVRWVDVRVGGRNPRQAKKVEHDLVEWLVVAACAVLSGADTFVAVGVWAKEKLDGLRKSLKLERGIPCHDTLGRVFAARDPDEFGAAFLRGVVQVGPTRAKGDVVAIDGKTSRRSGKVGATPLPLVSAFAAQAGRVLEQRATAAKSNEKTAIPERLATWTLEGGIVTLDALGTQPNMAQAIRDRGADMGWRSRTISPHGPSRSRILSAPSRQHQARRLISFTKSSRKTMVGWRSGGAMSSTRLTACSLPTAGQT